MNRYNIFNQVHKGLRGLLYETALVLQRTDFTNKEETEIALDSVSEVIELFEKHAYSEDNFVLPALESYEPAVVASFEDEHEKDHRLGQRLKDICFVLTHSIASETKVETGRIFNHAFVDFMLFNLEHMAKEETVLNKFLWRYYTDDQLHQMTQQIIAHIPPEMMARYSRVMMRGLSNNEIIAWLKQVHGNAPAFAFDALMVTAEKELHHQRWQRVRGFVEEEAA